MSYFRQSRSQKTSVAATSTRYLQLWPVLAASDDTNRKNHVPGTYLTSVPAPAQAQWTVGGASRTVVAGLVFGHVILARVPGCDAAPVHRVDVAQTCNETDISNNQNILCIYLHGSTNWYTTLVKYHRIALKILSFRLYWWLFGGSKIFPNTFSVRFWGLMTTSLAFVGYLCPWDWIDFVIKFGFGLGHPKEFWIWKVPPLLFIFSK